VKNTFFFFVFAFLSIGVLSAADWPSWQGANRDNVCTEKGLLQEWPEVGPTLAWKTTGIGEGFGGPAIVGDRLYIMGHQGVPQEDRDSARPRPSKMDGKQTFGQLWVYCLDLCQQGKQIWAVDLGPVRHNGAGFPGTRTTPTVDGDRLYLLGIFGELICLDTKDGSVAWRKDLIKDFGGTVPMWGYSETPLIDGDKLVCTPGGKENTMIALNKKDGSVIWHAALGDVADYASVVKAKIGGVEQYVNATHQGVIGVDAKTGELLWRYKEMEVAEGKRGANIATPIVSGDSVFASRAYDHGGGRADISRNGDRFEAKQVFFTEKMQNHHGGVVLVDGMLYGADNVKFLTCLDYQTGEVKWSNKKPGKCSVLYADGMLYCQDEKGPISLVKATPDGFELKGRFTPSDRSKKSAWTHLVIADGKMYVRDQDVLQCYEVREKE
jgi:outer membrane protein assembly factor BamB